MPIARRQVGARIVSWGVLLDGDSRLALETVTSELVTNAVRHSDQSMLTVAVHVSGRLRRALIEVYDGSAVLPRRRQAGTGAESGRGLELVGCLALAYGAERTEHGKRVWAELALPEQPVTRRQVLCGPRHALRAVLNALSRRPWTPAPARYCPAGTRPAAPARQAGTS
ncbi:hypothetical protein GCM10010505_31980 [Kitasatospora aburaviensis]